MYFRTLLSLMLFGVLAACNHYNYSPNLVATPYIVHKNESSIAVNAGRVLNGGSFDAQAAYNPANRITLMANYFQSSDRFSGGLYDDIDQEFRIRHLEGAAGGWIHLGEKPFYMGCFLGGGAGKVLNDFGLSQIARLRYNKAFFQPTIIYSGSLFRFGIASRLSRLTYERGFINTGIPTEDINILKKIEEKSPFYLIEGGLNAGFYVEGISFTANIVQISLIGGKVTGLFYDYKFDIVNFSLGIGIDLHEFFYKKQKKKPVSTEPSQ